MGESGDWVIVATLGRTHGLRGAIYGDGWQGVERFRPLRQVRLRRPDGTMVEDGRPFGLVSVRAMGARLLFQFEGIDTLEQAEPLTGCEVVVPPEERAPLEEGEFYLSDLLGCVVYDRVSGRDLGVVESWQEFGGPPTLEVRVGDELVWIPAVRPILALIDVAAKRIEIDPPEGLLEVNASGSRG
jgi:16S rRNA processing protein RimM